MKYWMIVKSGINRKKIRTFMTVFSIATAFLLFSLGDQLLLPLIVRLILQVTIGL